MFMIMFLKADLIICNVLLKLLKDSQHKKYKITMSARYSTYCTTKQVLIYAYIN